MKKLRELRTTAKYTQENLAEMLKVSQQTIARWEAGKVEPNIAALRDLAVIFGTSVDDLLDIEKNKIDQITTNHYHIFGGKISDGFWGYLGLLLPGHEKTKWYPITLSEADRISSRLSDQSEGHDWFVISTLNNRMLVFPISAIKRIWLRDDNMDYPKDDWDLSWDEDAGYSPEIYQALEDYFYDPDSEKYSETLRKIIKELVEEHEIDEEKLAKWILNTHIHFVDGTFMNYDVEEEQLESLVFTAQLEMDSVLRLDNVNGMESYYPATAVRLIDMPLLKYHKGRKEVYKEDGVEQEVI